MVYKILCVYIQIYAHISAKPDVSYPTFPGGLYSRSEEVSFQFESAVVSASDQCSICIQLRLQKYNFKKT